MDDGEPPFDLWEVDIHRAQPFQRNRRYLKERVSETLGLLYTDHFPYRQEAGLGFAVKTDKGDFTGREAVLRKREERLARRRSRRSRSA